MERTMAVFQSPEASGSTGAMLMDAKHGAHMAIKRNMANFGFATNINRKVKTLWLDEGESRATCFLKKGEHHVETKTNRRLPRS